MSNVALMRDLAGLPPQVRDTLGGTRAVRALMGTVSNADDGTPVVLGQISAGSFVLGVFVNVRTAFDGTGTDLIDVGTNTDPDGFAVDVDGATAGVVYEADGALIGEVTTDDQVEVLYSDANTDSTEGEAHVVVLFLEGRT